MKLLFLLVLALPFVFTSVEAIEEPQLDLCPTCISLMEQTINQLLNIILNVGVIGSCGKLCNYLSQYGQIVVVACDLVCDYVGIEEFIKVIKMADLDPIWMCQEIKICPIHDCIADVCAEFSEETEISPNPGKVGGTVNFLWNFDVYEHTGTGEVKFTIHDAPGSEPAYIGFSELIPKGYEKGHYQFSAAVTFKDNMEADPPVIFKPGQYHAKIRLCEGMCGSKHKHTRELADQESEFTLTM